MSNRREYTDMFEHPDADTAVMAWLQEKHATLWGRAFDLGDSDSLASAARFFMDQTNEFRQWLADKVREFNEAELVADAEHAFNRQYYEDDSLTER